tara:strand:- start:58 stop:753 length:696 start_codon:yes stop_codon:yes gene_type:complete
MPYKDPEKQKQYFAEYRLRNKERKRLQDREYREKNRETLSKKRKEKWQSRTDEQKLIDYEKGKKYREDNKERISKQRRTYWANRPNKVVEETRIKKKKYKEENKDYFRKIDKEWRIENREKIVKYREDNKDRLNKLTRQKRRDKRQKLIELMGGKCVKCNSTDRLQFDHIDPNIRSYAIGGHLYKKLDELILESKKCQLLCPRCHLEKTKDEWITGVLTEKRNKNYEKKNR